MRNTKKETLEKVKEILMNNSYKDYYKKNIEGSFEETMSVNNNVLSVIGNGVVVLTEEVYQALLLVHKLTITKNEEIPFFLFGKEIGNNQILFNQFLLGNNNEYFYKNQLIDNLSTKIDSADTNHLVICKGHSHPPIGLFYEHFSIGDLASDIQFEEENPVFERKKIELISCVITPSKDINFLYYDNKTQKFYRFSKVLVKNKNNMYTRISCYGDEHQKNLQKNR